MIVKAIRTRAFLPPKDDLFSLIKKSFMGLNLKEKSIIVITSKIVAIGQGRCVKMEKGVDKDDLIKKEADLYIDRKEVPEGYVMLTIKNGILIPTAGIDESNAKGYYILWPKKPFKAAEEIYDFIKKEYKLKNFGVLITDSHCTPLRNGIIGIGLAFCGFYPLKDYRGEADIFGRKMKMSQSNIVDSLASAAVLEMGEGAEQTPMAVIEGVDFIKFGKFKNLEKLMKIDIDRDIYSPLIKSTKWKKK